MKKFLEMLKKNKMKALVFLAVMVLAFFFLGGKCPAQTPRWNFPPFFFFVNPSLSTRVLEISRGISTCPS